MEIWKRFAEAPSYEVSSLGRVRRSGGVRCPFNNKRYLQIRLWESNRPRTYSVHRMVAICFIPNPLGLPQVNHKDGNKLNNRVENLEWCTAKENVHHAISLGLNIHAGSPLRREHEQALLAGASVKKILREIGGQATTVRKVRSDLGLEPRSQRRFHGLDLEAIKAFRGSVRDCAKAFGISKSTAHRAMALAQRAP